MCVSRFFFVAADYANFNEEDLLAQVIAQSQQEYINSFKKNALNTPTTSDINMPFPSNNQSGPSTS